MDKKTVPFEIKYRPEIESGKYKVITNGDHKPVRIICWDRAVFAKPDEPTIMYLVDMGNGEEVCFNYSREDCAKSLLIVTDVPKYTEFEAAVKQCLAFNYGLEFDDENYEVLKSTCNSILTLAKDAIRKKMMSSVKMMDFQEDSDLAKNAIGELTVSGFMNNRCRAEIAEWLKDVPLRLYHSGNVKLPTWQHAYAGTHFNGLAITYCPSGKDYPRLTSTAQTDCLYILIDELFNLPKEQ
jgi:hypothetical protein